jgi:AraC family transcriptional regulator
VDWRNKIHSKENDSFQTNFDWIRKMNNAITYIENHLDSDVDLGEAAKVAYCSVYHFQRFFSFIAEIPLSEYIRRRRLTLAAFELQNTNSKIIDVALRFGYDSPESFARAFKNMHGITPTAAKVNGTQLKAYPCITFHISIKGDVEMNYRIEKREAFDMFGVDTEVSTVDNQNFVTVPDFWEKCRNNGAIDKIRKAAGIGENTPLHAAMFNCTDTSHSYLIGYFAPENSNLKDFTVITIPDSTFAIFPTEELNMAETTQQAAFLWKRIFTEWFATSGYELASDIPEFELHHSKGEGKFVTEIFIPIVKNSFVE